MDAVNGTTAVLNGSLSVTLHAELRCGGEAAEGKLVKFFSGDANGQYLAETTTDERGEAGKVIQFPLGLSSLGIIANGVYATFGGDSTCGYANNNGPLNVAL